MKKEMNYVVYTMILLVVLLYSIRAPRPLRGSESSDKKPGFAAHEVLARFRDCGNSSIITAEIDALNATIISSQHAEIAPSNWIPDLLSHRSFDGDRSLFRIKLPESMDVNTAISMLMSNPQVEYACKNVCLYPLGTDPLYGEQWALDHIQAAEAWALFTGNSDIVVAVIDNGMEFNHLDLQSNVWNNPGENGLDANGNPKNNNNADDDHNGKADDYRGWDFGHDDNDPSHDENDPTSHGTEIAGIIGATWNNDEGIRGVNQSVAIMVIKFTYSPLIGSGTSLASDFINAIDYAISNGASIISCSRGFKPEQASDPSIAFEYFPLKEAIQRAQTRGVLFVTAAGNDGACIEPALFSPPCWCTSSSPIYPASYDEDNILSVLATTIKDRPGGCYGAEEHIDNGSNYGACSVDMGAPGVCIMTTARNGGYALASGTSQAAPQVAGVAALLLGKCPALTYDLLKSRLMATGDSLSTLQAKCVSGKRLNAYSAIYDPLFPVTPAAPLIVNAYPTAWNTIVINWQDNSSNEIGFEIQRYNSDKPMFHRYTSVGQQITTFTDHYAYTRPDGGGIVHSYRVRAGNIGGGMSPFSGTVNAYVPYISPAAPSSLTAETSTIPNIVLTWADNANNEQSFRIERKKLGSGNWTQIAAPLANSTAYTDQVTLPGTYYYRMRSSNPVGNSAYSNQITVMVENW